MIKKLLSYLGRYKKFAIFGPIMAVGEVVLEVLIPYTMAQIVDVGVADKNINYIVKMGLVMVAMAMGSLAFGGLSAWSAAAASTGIAKGLRKGLFDTIQNFSFSNIDKFSTSSLITRLTTDVTNTQNAFMMCIRMMIRAPVMLICAVFFAVMINRELALVFLAAIPILGIALFVIASKASPRYREMLKKYDGLNSVIQEDLIGIRVVKAFVREDHESKKFENIANQVRQAQFNAERLLQVNMSLMQLVMYACIIAVSWFGGKMIIAGGMQTGEFMSFISYISQILMALMMMAMVFINIVLSGASLKRIIEVLDEKASIKEKENAAATIADGSILFDHVSFDYHEQTDNPVLHDISFHISAGETVGIIGGTGSAKSTLVQLIPRLYDVGSGNVFVGGKDVRDYDIESLRDSVAMVLQKNVLFSGTIRENLQWGNPVADDETIIRACKAADAHNFVMGFPNGYDTKLEQCGVNLSGGQKQRICIARALLKNPKIIILDDSTSAVDTATDSRIRKALKEGLAGTTTIIISQRIISVQDADRIIVMDDGRINGMGTHQELLTNNMIYKEVYDSQQAGVSEHAGA
ncbi:MAG: ABC transporter ATP-binding protein/permease [Treponema sp.]|jgi:ATP-binding cassette subfamily B protein|nr:ABC transporter ATP-binding protein/permease [Treponema sp.]